MIALLASVAIAIQQPAPSLPPIPEAPAASFISVLDAERRGTWVKDDTGERLTAGDEMVTVGEHSVLRLAERLDDFVFEAEFRMTRGAVVGFAARAWGEMKNNTFGKLVEGSELEIASGKDSVTIFLYHPSGPKKVVRRSEYIGAALPQGDEWHRVRLACRDETCWLELNARTIAVVQPTAQPSGYISIHPKKGQLQLRSARIALLEAKDAEFGRGAIMRKRFQTSGNEEWSVPGVEMPKPLRMKKPEYTRDALNARIEGAVLLECVVETGGTVGQVRIARSLDRNFGLDQVAVDSAKQWLFEPARLDGKAVRIVVTLEMSFTLKR
jgi:TonB family protein